MGCTDFTTLTFGEGWDTSNVVNFCNMFHQCDELETVSGIENWNTGSALYMSDMFSSSSKLKADCSSWNVSKVVDHYAFNTGAGKVTQPTWS